MPDAAERQVVAVERISFTDALCSLRDTPPNILPSDLVTIAVRPNRSEPVVRKQRPKDDSLMNKKRGELRERLVNQVMAA
jgi:hypothetical protein